MAEVTPTERVSAEERIKQIQERADAATGGKWWWKSELGYLLGLQATRISPWKWVITWKGDGIKNEGLLISEEDMAFISHAREDIPWLLSRLSEVEELRKQLDCGHPASLLVRSVESDYSFCELCEARKERNDALEMERHYKAKLAAAEAHRNAAIVVLRGKCSDAEWQNLSETFAEAVKDLDSKAKRLREMEGALRYLLMVREIKCQHKHPGPDMTCANCRAESALALPPSEEEPRP